jgi:hypothetical protein
MDNFVQLLFNPTAEQLLFIILIIVLPIVLLWAKSKKVKLEEPVMEIGGDKGKLAIGNKDYEV